MMKPETQICRGPSKQFIDTHIAKLITLEDIFNKNSICYFFKSGFYDQICFIRLY